MQIITFLKNILILLVPKSKQKRKGIIDNRDLNLYKEMTNPAICKLAGFLNCLILTSVRFLRSIHLLNKSTT